MGISQIFTLEQEYEYPCKTCGSTNTTCYREFEIIDDIIELCHSVHIEYCKDCKCSYHTPQTHSECLYRTYNINILLPHWKSEYYRKVLAHKADWCRIPENIAQAIRKSIPLIEIKEKEDKEFYSQMQKLNSSF